MHRLIDDICVFLESNGFDCSRQIRHGLDVICTKTLGGKHERLILPLEINARTLEEASQTSEETYEAIRMIRSLEGYPLIITEDRWKRQREMMEARLLAHLELFSQAYARNCEIRRIEKAEAREFLDKYHSYGYAACKYRYGLFLKRHTGHIAAEMRFPIGSGMTERDVIPGSTGNPGMTEGDVIPGSTGNLGMTEGKLIAVATFSNARKWIKDGKEIRSYEWTRYASLPDLRVSGGMGKLLKAFIKEVQPDDIMSYADLEWSEGEVYERLGFKAEMQKEAVAFAIDPQSWERMAIGRSLDKLGMTDNKLGMTKEGSEMTKGNVIPGPTGNLFFQNFGSRKYRLKLTEYR